MRRSRRPDAPPSRVRDSRPDPLGLFLLRRSLIPTVVLREVEDRRTFHPARIRTAAPIVSRSSTRLVSPAATVRGGFPSSKVGFAVPRDVAICVRRKQRKEVIHAKGHAGGGGSSRRRWTVFSNVKC